MNRAGWVHLRELVIAVCLVACGQTSKQAPATLSTGGAESAAAGGTSGGSFASGGAVDSSGGTGGSSGGASAVASGGAAGSCGQGMSGQDFVAAPFVGLPTRLSGTLCGPAQALWTTFEGDAGEPSRKVIRARLVQSAGGTYTITLFGVVNGALQALANPHETNVFELDETTPELVFGFQLSASSENRVVLKLEGPAGAVGLDLDRPDSPPPNPTCVGGYESLPVKTPPLALPVVIETEFCNFRDSRAWSIEVAAGRPVTVTLENPWSIEGVDLGAYRGDVEGYAPLPVTEGVIKTRLGLLAHGSFSFTPAEAGAAALYGALGASRGEAVRLRVEQE